MKQEINTKKWKIAALAVVAVGGTASIWSTVIPDDLEVVGDVSVGTTSRKNLDVNGNITAAGVIVDGPDTIHGANTFTYSSNNDGGSMVLGNGNNIGSYTMAVGIGNSNSAPTQGWAGFGQTALGEYNQVGPYSLLVGSYNSGGRYSFSSGRNNSFGITNSSYTFALGRDNEVNGNHSGALGVDNYTSGSNALAFGMDNDVYGGYTGNISHSIAIGRGLHSSPYQNGTGSVVVGQYNIDDLGLFADRIFVVGAGTDTANRADSLVVKQDGSVEIGKTTYTDNAVPLHIKANGDVILSKAQGDISMGAFGN